MTDTTIEDTTLELIELNALWGESIKCDVARADCEREVKWKAIFKCCGAAGFACDFHLEHQQNRIRSNHLLGKKVMCRTCGTNLGAPAELTDIVDIYPV